MVIAFKPKEIEFFFYFTLILRVKDSSIPPHYFYSCHFVAGVTRVALMSSVNSSSCCCCFFSSATIGATLHEGNYKFFIFFTTNPENEANAYTDLFMDSRLLLDLLSNIVKTFNYLHVLVLWCIHVWVVSISNGVYSATANDNRNAGLTVASPAHLESIWR